MTSPSPRKKNAKWLSEEALQIAGKRGEAKGKGEKEIFTHLNAEFQRRARRVLFLLSNSGLLHCRQILYQLSCEGSYRWKHMHRFEIHLRRSIKGT